MLAVAALVVMAIVVAALVHVLRERQREVRDLATGALMRAQLLKHADDARRVYELSTPPALREAQQAKAMQEFQAAEAAVRVNQALATGGGADRSAVTASAVAAMLPAPASTPATGAAASQPLLPNIPVTAAALQATQQLAAEAAARQAVAPASAWQQKGRTEVTPIRP